MGKRRMSVSLREETADWLQDLATREDLPVSIVLDLLIKEAMQREEGAKVKASNKPFTAARQDTTRDWWELPVSGPQPKDTRRNPPSYPPGSPEHDARCWEWVARYRQKKLEAGPEYDKYVRLCNYIGACPVPPYVLSEAEREEKEASKVPDRPPGMTEAQQHAWEWLYDGTDTSNGVEMVEAGLLDDVWFAAELRQLVVEVKAGKFN